MGCDCYADENGEFEVLISDYDKGGKVLRNIRIAGLKPNNRIDLEIIRGKWR